jgi:micrococcal nuclease
MMALTRSLVAALLALLLVACGQLTGGAEPRPASPAALAGDYPAMPSGLARARMVRVVDGDTIVVRVGGREERVRFIGINTPESVDPRRPVQCFGKEASANAEALLDVPAVLLEEDESQGSRDSSGRLLRYVWLEDGRMANLEQLAGGFAAEYTFDTPYKYREEFRAAQRVAREEGRGLWAAATCGGQFSPVEEGSGTGTTAATPTPERLAGCPDAARPDGAPETPVRIVGLDKGGEVVELRNVGGAPVDLDGWVLCSLRGGEPQGGLSGALGPGETRAFVNPGGPIWSNGNRDDAALFDPNGRLVSYWADNS